MDLRQGGGDAHGHVHHRPQGADDDAAYQQAPQADGCAGLAQLQQRLYVLDAQAVHPGQGLGQQPEQQGQGRARHGAQHGAHALFLHAAHNGQAHHRHIGAHDKGHQQGIGPLHQRRQQHAEQAHQRHRQSHQRLGPGAAAYDHRRRDEQRHHDGQGDQPVEFIHRGVDGAVGIAGDQDGGPVPGVERPAVQGTHIVIYLHLLALIVPGLHGNQQQLLSPVPVVGGWVLLRGVRQDLLHHGGFIVRPLLRLAGFHPGRGCQQPPHDQQHQGRRQHRAGPLVFPQPGGRTRLFCLFLHKNLFLSANGKLSSPA